MKKRFVGLVLLLMVLCFPLYMLHDVPQEQVTRGELEALENLVLHFTDNLSGCDNVLNNSINDLEYEFRKHVFCEKNNVLIPTPPQVGVLRWWIPYSRLLIHFCSGEEGWYHEDNITTVSCPEIIVDGVCWLDVNLHEDLLVNVTDSHWEVEWK